MSGAFNSPRHKRRPSITITPLIDVMFLLLIFFMVSSTFKEHLGVDIVLPQAESAENEDITSHEIAVDREGQFYLGGEKVDEGELNEALAALIEAEADATFVLRADREADFGRVLRVIDIARSVGGERLIIPTELLDLTGASP